MDVKCKQVAEIEQSTDVDSWIQEFLTPNCNQVYGNAGNEGRTKDFGLDADYVCPLNVAGCSMDKSSSHAETKTGFVPGLPWNSKPMNCNSDPQQARTSEAPVHISHLQSKPSRSHDPYNIVESSIHLKTSLMSYGSQVSESLMPQPNQLQHLLRQVSQQPNNQSSVMQSSAQNCSQIQLNKEQYSQHSLSTTLEEQWPRDWVGNNTSVLQKGLQDTHNNIAGKWQHLQAFQHDMISSRSQPQHTNGFQSHFSSSQAHPYPLDIPWHSYPTTIQKDFLHLRSFQSQTDSSPQGSNQIMQTSSLLNSQSPMAGFSQKPIGNSQGKLARGSSGSIQPLPPNAELSVKYENTRVFVEKMIKFLQMSKVDFIQHSKEKVCQYMNLITNYLDEVRMKNSATLQKHLQQLQVPRTPPIMHQTGNGDFQFNQSTLGLSGGTPQSSSQLELSHPKASLLNSSGEVSIKGCEAAETLSRSSKRPMHQYIISWQQNANISASSSQSSSQSEQEQRSLRLPGSVANLDSTLSNRDHATSLPANTVNPFASALTLSQKTKQPMWQAIPLFTNTASALGSPLTQLQKVMQLEGQIVTEQKKLTQKSNEVNESKSNSSQLQPASPQNSQQSFPLSAISPSIALSPLTPLTPSSMSESPQKVSSSLGLSLFAEGIKAPKIQSKPDKLDFQSINTVGAHNMPLVMKRIHSEGNQQPKRAFERLLDVIGSISKESFCASVCDIGNVVNMIDMRAGTLCYPDYRGSIGDDLMDDVRCFLRKAKLRRHGTMMDDKMKRNINATDSTAFSRSLQGSDGMDWANNMSPEIVAKATSIIKCPNAELKSRVLEEIKETNRKLVETRVEMVVDSSEDNVHRLGAEENITIRCSYSPMGFCENTLQRCTSSGIMFPEMLVLQLLVLGNYPKVSPIVLDKSPDLFSTEEVRNGYREVKLRFNLSLRQLSEPMSIREMAKTWDICARQVFAEFAERMGGGSFSSVCGVWEKCEAAAT
nr:mediator of RNA polymerase II transcription subunit 15A-like [Ipomoea batatas]